MRKQHNKIQDKGYYLGEMNKSLIDKLFFVDKVEADVYIDFGCATGDLLGVISQWSPDARFLGYDNNPEMIDEANQRFKTDDRFDFYLNWDELKTQVDIARAKGEKTAIVCSSIIHEIYHYSEPHEVDLFWSRLFETGFDYIVIRDMVPSQSIDRPSDTNDVARVFSKFLYTQELRDFQSIWGSIENNKNLIHFLLKYRYKAPSWDREVAENYIPLYRENLLARVPLSYSVIYDEHYVLPFIRRQVRQDVGIDIKDPTHFKIILEK